MGLILGLGRSPGIGNGNPIQYSCLENSMDSGAWQATVHGATELDTTERLRACVSVLMHTPQHADTWQCLTFASDS